MQSISDRKRAGYFKLAEWDARSMTFRDGKRAFATHDEAVGAAKHPGTFRVSAVTEQGRQDFAPFTR